MPLTEQEACRAAKSEFGRIIRGYMAGRIQERQTFGTLTSEGETSGDAPPPRRVTKSVTRSVGRSLFRTLGYYFVRSLTSFEKW
jgi:hypothetical protein